METLLLSKADVGEIAEHCDIISAVESAYKAYSNDLVVQPDYISFHC